MTDRRPGEAGAEHENGPERARDGPATADGTEQPDDPVPEPPDCVDELADDHVEELPDGAGCTEIWEHLSERRAEDGEEEP